MGPPVEEVYKGAIRGGLYTVNNVEFLLITNPGLSPVKLLRKNQNRWCGPCPR